MTRRFAILGGFAVFLSSLILDPSSLQSQEPKDKQKTLKELRESFDLDQA